MVLKIKDEQVHYFFQRKMGRKMGGLVFDSLACRFIMQLSKLGGSQAGERGREKNPFSYVCLHPKCVSGTFPGAAH